MPERDLIDISVPISERTPVWAGDPPVRIDRVSSMADGAGCNLSHLALTAHTATHIDAPLHFLAHGAAMDELPPDVFIGPARVVEVGAEECIRAEDIDAAQLREGERILLKTRNSELWSRGEFGEDYVALDEGAATAAAEAAPRLLGIDYLSVGPFKRGGKVHRILLGAGIVLLEGIDLSVVQPGEYELLCLPLLIPGCEGAPARAFLRR